jgi:hypothetical protein
MTDTITTPVSPAAPPPEAPLAPIESEGEPLPDILGRHLPPGEILTTDDLGKLYEKKKQDGSAITDLHSKPVVPMRYLDKQEKSLRQVSDDTKRYHNQERAQELLGETAKNFDAAQQQELGRLLNPDLKPPDKIGLSLDGREVAPMKDLSPVMLEDSGNLKQITEMQGDWRQAKAEREAAYRDELVREQNAAIERQAEAARQEEIARQEPPPPQPDVVQEERTRLDTERRALGELHRASVEEREAINERQQIRQFVDTAYPPQIRTPEGWAELQRTNPQHAQYLQEWLPQAVARDNELFQGLQHAGQIRNAQAIQAQQVRQQQFDAWGRQQDSQARAAISKDFPQYASDEAYARLRSAAPRALAKLGINQAEADRLWRDGTLRSVPAQRMIAKLASQELAQDRIANRAPIPPVQRPGVARPAGAGDLDSVRDLENRMANANAGIQAPCQRVPRIPRLVASMERKHHDEI